MSENSSAPNTSPTPTAAPASAEQKPRSPFRVDNMPPKASEPAVPKAEQKPEPDLVKEAAKEAKRKFKIDNEEVDEDEVFKIYKERKGHQQAANKILQEGKAARKQAEQFIEMMKSPDKLISALSKMGYTDDQVFNLAENYMGQKLEERYMDPKEKEFRDTKSKLQAYEKAEQKQKEAVQKRHYEEQKAKHAEEYTGQFLTALKETDLPVENPMVAKAMIGEMAKYIHHYAGMGIEVSPKEAAQLVRQDRELSNKRLLANADGETLLKLLGDEAAAKILTARGSKVKNPQQVLSTPTEQGQPRERSSKTRDPREWARIKRGLK